jgi:hypothetical protein
MFILLIAAALPAASQTVGGSPDVAAHASAPAAGPLLFPKNWVRGFADFEFAPPTNEVDLGRCQSSVGQLEGSSARCAAFASYMLSGYVELRPFARTALRRVFLFATPRMFFGDTVPQVNYSAEPTPIAVENTIGAGVELGNNFELRAVRHWVSWIGRYRGYLGPADLGPNGPYGRYATFGVRWNFGGYGRTADGR